MGDSHLFVLDLVISDASCCNCGASIPADTLVALVEERAVDADDDEDDDDVTCLECARSAILEWLNTPIRLSEIADDIVGALAPREAQILTRLRTRDLLDDVERIAAEHHVTVLDVVGRDRLAPTVAARHAAWLHLLREHDLSYATIGRLFAVHHTTVMDGAAAALARLGTRRTLPPPTNTGELAAAAGHAR